MILEALLLICSAPQIDDAPQVVDDPPASISENKTKESSSAAPMPGMPEPKPNTDLEAVAPAGVPPLQPVKPALVQPRETQRQRVIWYGLLVAGHGGAA